MRQPWKIFGASVQGTMHLKNVKPCQDAYLFKSFTNNNLILAVADGAGTADHSDAGALLAVSEAVNSIESKLNDRSVVGETEISGIVRNAFETAQTMLQKKAAENGHQVRSYATTLTVVVSAASHLVAAQIGDGAAVAENCQGEFRLLTTPQRGEYANETFFLTDENALQTMEINVYEDEYQTLFAMTDGLIRLAFHLPEFKPHPQFFLPLSAFARKASEQDAGNEKIKTFLSSKKVCDRTSDDKSLVIAAR